MMEEKEIESSIFISALHQLESQETLFKGEYTKRNFYSFLKNVIANIRIKWLQKIQKTLSKYMCFGW